MIVRVSFNTFASNIGLRESLPVDGCDGYYGKTGLIDSNLERSGCGKFDQ